MPHRAAVAFFDTNAFSKKRANQAAAVALYFMWYNFGRVHMTLGCTPAQAAGVERHAWTIADVVALLEPKAEWRREPQAAYRIVKNPTVPSK